MDIEVNRCPFCGGKSRVHKYLSKYYARCNKCDTHSAPYDTPEQAAAAWNTRAYSKCENSRKGACKDCKHHSFRKCHNFRGYELFCKKHNVSMLYEDSCSDFQYPEYAPTDEQGN